METLRKESGKDSEDVPLPGPSQKLSLHLNASQQQEVEQIAKAINVQELSSADIIQIGYSAEKALQDTLDGFLARLDSASANQVFQLFEKLEKGVKDADLPEVLRKIQHSKPGFMTRFWGMLRGKSPKQVASETYNQIKEVLSGKTQTLVHQVKQIENGLFDSIQKLNAELDTMSDLKQSYHDHLERFAIVAASSEIVLSNAKAELAKMEASNDYLTQDNPIAQAKLQEMRQKVQLLESRTLSLVGSYMRLPADHIIIQQIEQAGVATLQETTITAASRFSSIKTTLLAVNGAFNVKAVQQIAERQAKMDEQLQKVRSQITKEIVTTAMSNPGDNRLEQAAQIEKIIADAVEIKTLINKAQAINEEKFNTARARFEAVRKELAAN